MNSFNGETLFGPVSTITPKMNPNDHQVVAYPGVNGVEVRDLGSRDGLITVTGELMGATLADLKDAEAALRTYQRDGTLATLHDDTLGINWNNCYLLQFQIEEAINTLAGGGFCRHFTAQFHYLG